jgi:hypothetical protein
MLNLEGWNRKLLREQKALSTDSAGKETFVGLTREESESYIELMKSNSPTDSDNFIDLERKHTAARTGFR